MCATTFCLTMVHERELSAYSEKEYASASTCALVNVSCRHDHVASMSEEESFSLAEEEIPALPVTPSKSQAAKKKANNVDIDISSQLDNIMQQVSRHSDTRVKDLPLE